MNGANVTFGIGLIFITCTSKRLCLFCLAAHAIIYVCSVHYHLLALHATSALRLQPAWLRLQPAWNSLSSPHQRHRTQVRRACSWKEAPACCRRTAWVSLPAQTIVQSHPLSARQRVRASIAAQPQQGRSRHASSRTVATPNSIAWEEGGGLS